LCQTRDFVRRNRVTYDQSRMGLAGKPPQGIVQADQRFSDELHAPVAPWQGFEDGTVEYEDTVHLFTGLEGPGQGGIVVRAQVAPKPHQADRIS